MKNENENETHVPERSNKEAFAEYVANVMRGWAEGKMVQYRQLPFVTTWNRCKMPDWNWCMFDYRLAPEAPKVEPWTFETAPMLFKVRNKKDGGLYVAVCYPRYAAFGAGSSTTHISYAELADQFEQLDGTPCGTVQKGDGE